MNEPSQPPIHAPSTPVPAASNGLGLAGFITALVGIAVTGGLLCPVGLVLSVIALSRRPRGFAIAGTVIGALGSCGSCVLGLAVLTGSVAAMIAAIVLVAMGGVPAVHTIDHMLQVRSAIQKFELANHAVPQSLADLNLPKDMLEDGWGTPLEFTVNPQGSQACWTLRSAGPDRKLDSGDITFRDCVDVTKP